MPLKITDAQIAEILMLKRKHPDLSLRQISAYTRRKGKHLGVSHQTVKRYLDANPQATLKIGDTVQLTQDVSFRFHSLQCGEVVQIIGFTDDTLLVSHHRYPNAFDIPPTAVSQK